MYALKRRYDICSIGYYKNDKPGYPTKHSKFHWVQKCNFVFTVIGKVKSLQKIEFGSEDEYSGWMVKALTLEDGAKSEDRKGSTYTKYIYITNEIAACNSKLKKIFLNSIFGAICRLTSEDFWNFVEKDMHDYNMKVCYISTQCGKIYRGSTPITPGHRGEAPIITPGHTINDHMWIFPDITLSSNGTKIKQEEIFVNKHILLKGFKRNKIALPAVFRVHLHVQVST